MFGPLPACWLLQATIRTSSNRGLFSIFRTLLPKEKYMNPNTKKLLAPLLYLDNPRVCGKQPIFVDLVASSPFRSRSSSFEGGGVQRGPRWSLAPDPGAWRGDGCGPGVNKSVAWETSLGHRPVWGTSQRIEASNASICWGWCICFGHGWLGHPLHGV